MNMTIIHVGANEDLNEGSSSEYDEKYVIKVCH